MRAAALALTAALAATLAAALAPGRAAPVDNRLFILQVGDDHIAAINQTGSDHRAASMQGAFDNYTGVADGVLDGSGLSLADIPVATADGTTLFKGRAGDLDSNGFTDLHDVLSDLSTSLKTATGGVVEIVQNNAEGGPDGARAVAVQVGIDNDLRTTQNGGAHVGVHVQDGNNNSTTLEQIGTATTGALVVIGNNHALTLTLENGAEAYVTRRGDGMDAEPLSISITGSGAPVFDPDGAGVVTITPPAE